MIFIKSLIVINIFLIFITFLPQIYIKNKTIDITTRIFNLFFYLIGIVLIYSVSNTKFNTILSGLLPIGGWIFYTKKDKISIKIQSFSDNFSFIKKILLITNVIFVINAISLFQGSWDFLKIINTDYLFYAKASYFLQNDGIETYLLSPYASSVPYHFFELWLNGLWIELGFNSYNALMLITYPILFLICYLFSFAIALHTKSEIQAHVFSTCLFFIKLVFIPILFEYSEFLVGGLTFCVNIITSHKLVMIYIAFLVSILTYQKFGINYFIYVVSTYAIIYSTLIFGAAGILGSVILLKLFTNGKIKWTPIIVLFLSLVFFQGFYKLNDLHNDLFPNINGEYIKTAINIIGGSIIRIVVFVIPFIVLSFFIKKKLISFVKHHSFILFLISCGILSSLLGWALLHQVHDSVQLFSNFAPPILCIGLTYLLFLADFKIGLIGTIIIIIVNFPNYINRFEITEQKVSLFKNMSKGALLKEMNKYSNNPFEMNSYGSYPLSESTLLNSSITMYDLSLVDIDTANFVNKSLLKKFRPINELQQFCTQNNVSGIKAKVNFIKHEKIQFLITSSTFKLHPNIKKMFQNMEKVDSYIVYYNK